MRQALVLLASLAGVVCAQMQVGSVAGTVKDPSGAVLPGVKVTISGEALLGGPRTLTTDDVGYFKFLDLKPGAYTLRFERSGFKTLIREGIMITSNFEATLHVDLEVGSTTESMTVRGEAPLVDVSNAVNQTVLHHDMIERIPNGRDPWVLARMVTGVNAGQLDVGGTQGMQQYSLTIHGSRDSDKKFAIDGVEVNWPGTTGGATAIYYDVGQFQEINYQTGALPAEISQGGVYMNMVTKDGGNTVHGQVLLTGANHAMQSNNVDDALREKLLAGIPAQFRKPGQKAGNPIEHIYDFNATAGGPVVKDKLWWFASYRRWSVNQFVSGALNPDGSNAIDDNLIWNWAGKLSWQVSPKHRLSFLYNRNWKYRYHRRDTPPYFIEDKAAAFQNQPGYSANLKWNFAATPKMVVESGLALTHIVFPLRYRPEVQPTDIRVDDTVQSTRKNAGSSNYVNPNYRLSWDSALSYVTSGLGGSHSLKFGTQLMRSYFRQDYRVNGDQAWIFADGNPSQVTIYNTPLSQQNYLHQFAWFAQDTWTLRRRLTLNLGLRWEYMLGVIPAQTSPAGAFAGARSFGEIHDVPNFKNWAPRFGLAWDLKGDGRTAIKASASRYTQNIGMTLVTAFNPFLLRNLNLTWRDANGDKVPQLSELPPIPTFAPVESVIDPELKRPYAWEYSLGVQHQLPGGLVVAVTGWHRDMRRQIGRQNTLAPRSEYTPKQVTNPLTGQPVTVWEQSARTRNQVLYLVTNLKDLDTAYNGMDVTFTKRFAQRWQVIGGYSFGREWGAYRGDVLVTGADDFNNPNFDLNRRGVVGNDITHSFKAGGTWRLPWNFEFSGGFGHASGGPLRRQLTVTGLTQGNVVLDVAQRGAVRLPGVTVADLRFSRIFTIRERVKLQPNLDLYNVGNVNTAVAVVEQIGSAVDRPSVIISPRLLKLGMKVDF